MLHTSHHRIKTNCDKIWLKDNDSKIKIDHD